MFSLSRILQDYIQEGNEYEEEWLSYLSPYVTAHVNRFGKYGSGAKTSKYLQVFSQTWTY